VEELRQLTPNDLLFIGGELPNVYQHSAGLVMLDARGRPGFGFESYRRYLEERVANVPHFHWRLHEVPLGLDMPYWVKDENFSFANHIRRIAVPSPGDREALSELCAYLYCRHLDHNHPLWETWFIEGLADGQFAVFNKLHHALMDGQGAIKLGEILCDFEPDAEPNPVDPEIAQSRPGSIPTRWQESLNLARRYSRLPAQMGREIYDLVLPTFSKRLKRGSREDGKAPLPIAHFNTDISADRGFVFGSIALEDIKAVKDYFQVTVNDVVLGLVAGSLRAYLLHLGKLPDEHLRTSIGVSLRQEGDSTLVNKVTTASVTLATLTTDPVERLQAIAEESNRVKAQARGGGKGFLEFIQVLPPFLVKAMMGLSPPEQVINLGGANLMVSNARGSSRPMYQGGARQSASYPMAILARGMALNITCVSYAGHIDFGITYEPSLFPEPWSMIEGLSVTLDEYLALSGGSTRTRKKPASKPKARKSAKRGAETARKTSVAGRKPATARRKSAPTKRERTTAKQRTR